MDENRIGQKQDWTKSFGPKQVGRKQGARKIHIEDIYRIFRAFPSQKILVIPSVIHEP